jgi:hypothetical protein
VEGRRDPHAAPSALGRPARAAAGSLAAEAAGPCVAGAAGRDGADRAPRRDAAHRHPRHHLALASRHRPPALVVPVAPWPVPAPAGAPQGPVGAAAGRDNESWGTAAGVPPHSRRACRERHHDGTVDGVADPQERRDRPSVIRTYLCARTVRPTRERWLNTQLIADSWAPTRAPSRSSRPLTVRSCIVAGHDHTVVPGLTDPEAIFRALVLEGNFCLATEERL